MTIPWPGRSAERSPSPLWVWPSVAGAVGAAAGLALSSLGETGRGVVDPIWAGDHAAASTLLQVVATANMTALTLTFTVTIVALQLASQQFSPRLLREFATDPGTKAVMAVLVGTLLFALVNLARMETGSPVPAVAMVIVLVLGVASIAAILAFIAHMLRSVRVDTMMLVVHDDTVRAIDRFYPAYGDERVLSGDEMEPGPGQGRTVLAHRSGFVLRTNVPRLVRAAEEHDGSICVEVRPGDHVVMGTPLATVWAASEAADDALGAAVRGGIDFGYERTLEQDAAFGFRQLEDIAVKAVSPSVNDPATAAHAVGHMADLLVRVMGCRLGSTLHLDGGGVGRVVVPDRDLRYYLDLACSQLRRFGAGEPTVLIALLRMLRDAAVATRDDHQRAELRRAADLVVAETDPGLAEVDRREVEALRARVESALNGDTVAAYADRTGETRSL